LYAGFTFFVVEYQIRTDVVGWLYSQRGYLCQILHIFRWIFIQYSLVWLYK